MEIRFCSVAGRGGTYRSTIHMNGRTQDFPTEHYPCNVQENVIPWSSSDANVSTVATYGSEQAAGFNLISTLWYSSYSVGLDNMHQPSLHTHINEPFNCCPSLDHSL